MGICLSVQDDSEEPIAVDRPSLPDATQSNQVQIPAHNNGGGLVPILPLQKQRLRLSQVDPKTVPDIPFKETIIEVFAYEISDGDTCKFLLDITQGAFIDSDQELEKAHNGILKLSLRLNGIDTPEIHAGQGRLPQEKAAAIKARDRLKQLVKGHVKVRLTGWDKYGGRCLGDVILADGRSAVQVLIDEGYGRPYHGEKKKEWTLAELTAPPFSVTQRDLEMADAVHEDLILNHDTMY